MSEPGRSHLTTSNPVAFDYASIEEAFPAVHAGIKPFGTVGVFQIKCPKRKTKGGILLVDDTQSTEYYNTQVAKVLSLGPSCFKSIDPQTGQLVDWPEGPWFKPGDFVRVPKYGGDRYEVSIVRDGERENVVIALFKVVNILGLIDGDPLQVRAFLD